MAKRRSRTTTPKPDKLKQSIIDMLADDEATSAASDADLMASHARLYGKPGVPDEGSPAMENYVADQFENKGAAGPKPSNVVDMLDKMRDRSNGMPNPTIDLTRHRVSLIRDHAVEYPELYLEVFIVGDKYEERNFAEMFIRSRCQKAKSLETADLVVFTGGVDVDPALYGIADKDRHPRTERSHHQRDSDDIAAYMKCLDLGIPMLGVCRGAQFGHVMNGGKLYQDVDNHNGAHSMWDVKKQKRIESVSSVHHQMCIQNTKGGMEIIGVSNKANNRWVDNDTNDKGIKSDVEAFFYRETCFIGIQGHPEYKGFPYFTKWTLDLLNELVCCNPDIGWIDKNRRMKPDLVKQRQSIMVIPEKEKN